MVPERILQKVKNTNQKVKKWKKPIALRAGGLVVV